MRLRRRVAAAGGAALLLAAAAALPPFPLPAAAAGEERRKPADLDGVAKLLASFAKRKALGKKDPEEVGRRIEGLAEADLSWLLDRLAEVPAADRGGAHAEVVDLLARARLAVRYGPAVLLLRDAAKRLADPAPAVRWAALADLERLEEAGPATALALECLGSRDRGERLRAVDTLADLASFGGDPARLLPALRGALGDPSPAVRDLALERLVDLSDPAVLDAALERLADGASEKCDVREAAEERCPGDRAFLLLARLSKDHQEEEPADFRRKPEAERAKVVADFRAWREKGGPNPLRDGDDGPFDAVPRVSTTVAAAGKTEVVKVRFWSEVDRAQFLLSLEDLDVVSSSTLDRVASFRLTIMASGARQGNWETLVRHLRCGERHRLARKGFALVETTIQPLLDGRVKVWVRSYESKGVVPK